MKFFARREILRNCLQIFLNANYQKSMNLSNNMLKQ